MAMKIALCMIAMNKEQQIINALNSTEGVFDVYCLQDTGSTDKTVEVWKKWCKDHDKECHTSKKYLGKHYKYVTVNNKKILGEFNKARNDSFKLAHKAGADFAFWCDSDDEIKNSDQIRPVVESMDKNNKHLGIMTYIYAKGDGKIKPVVQKRERIIDLRIKGEWVNWVHETFEPKQPVNAEIVDQIEVEHQRTGEAVLATGRRNHLIMKAQAEDEGIDSFSDAMLNNYAYDHWEHREYKQSIKIYKILLKRKLKASEFLFQVFIKVARAYMGLANNEKAVTYANKALELSKSIGDPYLILAEAYMNLGNWEESIYFADRVLKIGKPQTTAPVNEFEYIVIPRRIKINSYLKMGQAEKALEVADELVRITSDPNMVHERSQIRRDLMRKNAIVGINNIVKYLQDNNQMKYADRLKEAIPLGLLDDNIVRKIISEIVHDFRRKAYKVKLKGKKSIVFYAGDGVSNWDGETDTKRGIGGSEGMTIQLSRELAKLDNKVIVYNSCGNSAGKEFNGVIYEDYRKWDSDMKCDVFVSLRRPDVFQKLVKAKKQYLWLHDTDYGDLPTSLMYAPNKIIVLSEAHKDVIKKSHGITDDSIFWISRNGLNSVAMNYADKNKGKRRPYQMFYASSYDRGLDNALRAWPKIRKEVPEAELKIIYGWNTYDKLMQMRKSEQMARFKSQMIDMIASTEGVQELGRVSQNDHYMLAAESSILFYPSEFYEISFIGGMVAQAQGAVPITTPHAAMNETISTKYGIKVELPKIADCLIYYLKHPKELEKRRTPMMKWARDRFNMKSLALDWNNIFNG